MASGSRTSRRQWSETFKKRVVAEASEPGMTVTEIARRYDLDARRVSNWMKKFGSGGGVLGHLSEDVSETLEYLDDGRLS